MHDQVHLCDWSSQPDIHIVCDDSWTTPAWDEPRVRLPADVYVSDDRRLYTFEERLVTCPACNKAV